MLNHNRKRLTSTLGFALVEFLLVVIILGVLTSVSIPSYFVFRDRARYAATKQDMQGIGTGIALYFADHQAYPPGSDIEQLQQQILDYNHAIPLQDAWDIQYLYQSEEISYLLRSAGKDGIMGNEDDLVIVNGIMVSPEDVPGQNNGNGEDHGPYDGWDSQSVYLRGDYVIHGGNLYVARWWTQGQLPGLTESPWDEITDAWRDFNVYHTGDTVIYEGSVFKARNWTKGAQPGLTESPWQEITDAWRAFNVYHGGDEVYHNGQWYRAKWWTQEEQPGMATVWEPFH